MVKSSWLQFVLSQQLQGESRVAPGDLIWLYGTDCSVHYRLRKIVAWNLISTKTRPGRAKPYTCEELQHEDTPRRPRNAFLGALDVHR